MKRMVCEMCGGTDLIKQDGVFVCQSCGTKYSVEEARKMMIEGKVDVTGSTVKVDISDELANLYQLARRAREDNNSENAQKYYEQILVKDPSSWEANFYTTYFQAMNCKIGEIGVAAIRMSNCEKTVMTLIKENVSNIEEQKVAVMEVALASNSISTLLFNAYKITIMESTRRSGVDMYKSMQIIVRLHGILSIPAAIKSLKYLVMNSARSQLHAGRSG